jgi:hypothetical protein
MEEKERNEKTRIKETILNYVEGVQEFNFEKAESSWHSQGLKISYDSETESLSTITMVQSKPSSKPPKDLIQTAEILNIDVFDNAASVKMKWFQKRGDRSRIFIDYVSLIKIQNDWKIVAKISGTKEE